MVTVSCVPRNKYIFREKINCTFIKRQMRGYIYFYTGKGRTETQTIPLLLLYKVNKRVFRIEKETKGNILTKLFSGSAPY